MAVLSPAVGTALDRVEGREKVTGAARYAYEHPVEGVAYGALVQSTIGRGRVTSLDGDAALAVPGVLAVIWHGNALRLHSEGELAVLQSDAVAYRGQIVAVVVAERLEAARLAAALIEIAYEEEPHETRLRPDDPRMYAPEKVNPGFATDTDDGDFDAAFAAAAVKLDATYRTPWQHNNPIEPHAAIAWWEGDTLTVYDSTQGPGQAAGTIAAAFGLDPQQVRVISAHVGGGFGSKGTPRPVVVSTAMAARIVQRPVKIAVTRQQMFALTGYRTPTIQRLRLGASRDGRLDAIAHDVWEQTSTLTEFAEQTAVVTRMMYAGRHRRTTHRLAALDVPTPSWMRAPGECPGMFALESAIDELAVACGVDPIELRVLNEPDLDPETGRPFSSRGLVACLREGATRFGWAERPAEPGVVSDGRWLIGMGVASSTYPARRRPSQARVRRLGGERYEVGIAAADIGTGARTALTQIAADALSVAPEQVAVELGDSALPPAMLAGGSMGLASWGSAVVKACRTLVDGDGEEGFADTTDDVEADAALSRHGFGAQFAQVRVDPVSGEIRVPRLLGVFATGRIVNPKLARSQFIGGMTMGLGMALLEAGVLDPRFGDVVNRDLAGYHVATYADVDDLDAVWIDEQDDQLNPMGSKGIGEIGIVGTAAAVANAVFNATGRRFRSLPIGVADVVGSSA